MKALFIFILIFSTSAMAKPVFNAEEFSLLTSDQQVEVLKAYKDFLRDASAEFEADKFSTYKFSIIEEAFASGDFDCFFAGWPSVTRPSGKKRLCTSPKNGNPDYQRLASSCRENQLLCQPAIFGDGICVNVATRTQRNSAFKQCETKFAESGKSLADVARTLSSQEKRAKLNELVADSEHICRSGLRTQATLCQRLRNKLLDVKREVDKSQGQQLERVAEVAVQVTTARTEPQVDCDPNTPGIQTEAPRRAPPTTRVVAPTRVVTPAPQRIPSGELRRLFCSSEEIAGSTVAPNSILAFMRENNIQVVHGEASVQQLQEFVAEFSRFPQGIREEMRARGSSIHLIVGSSVSEDPSWEVERNRARPEDRANWDRTFDGRPSNIIPGTGGSLIDPRTKTPTRIVLNRLRDQGSVSLFLHEYAHTMDSMYGEHAVTQSQGWQQALAADARSTQFLNMICAENYCTNSQHPEEAFAELFAYYHACPSTRQQMESVLPNISQFMSRLTNVRAYLNRR